MSFNTNIFINCPFDNNYRPLLQALIFITLYFKFTPKIATTKSSSHVRINEIITLIRDSKYSIHDISRCEPLNTGELPRFNMPYEMGIDIGCINFGSAGQKTKQTLILEKTKNRYDVVISDISGQDIKEHNNKPKKLIEKVMDWFGANGAVPVADLRGISTVWAKYQECTAKIVITLTATGYTKSEIKKLPIPQYIAAMTSALS